MILQNHKKTLFQLGIFPFNTIVQILEEAQFNDIINLDYLRLNGNKVDYLENDTFHNYAHVNSNCTHTKYKNLELVHDYAFDGNTITNKKFIEASHKLKIQNFYNDIKANNKYMCFITFLFDSKLVDLEFKKMVDVLKNKYNIKKLIILIFTNEKNIIQDLPKEYEIITIENEYRDDIWRETEYKVNLYKDIWEKFRSTLKKYGCEYKCFEEIFDIRHMPGYVP